MKKIFFIALAFVAFSVSSVQAQKCCDKSKASASNCVKKESKAEVKADEKESKVTANKTEDKKARQAARSSAAVVATEAKKGKK